MAYTLQHKSHMTDTQLINLPHEVYIIGMIGLKRQFMPDSWWIHCGFYGGLKTKSFSHKAKITFKYMDSI